MGSHKTTQNKKKYLWSVLHCIKMYRATCAIIWFLDTFNHDHMLHKMIQLHFHIRKGKHLEWIINSRWSFLAYSILFQLFRIRSFNFLYYGLRFDSIVWKCIIPKHLEIRKLSPWYVVLLTFFLWVTLYPNMNVNQAQFFKRNLDKFTYSMIS